MFCTFVRSRLVYVKNIDIAIFSKYRINIVSKLKFWYWIINTDYWIIPYGYYPVLGKTICYSLPVVFRLCFGLINNNKITIKLCSSALFLFYAIHAYV